jgi:hypothetical protein
MLCQMGPVVVDRCSCPLDDVKITLLVRFWLRTIGADKMPRHARYWRVSGTILYGITMRMYAGSFVVEGGCFLSDVREFS